MNNYVMEHGLDSITQVKVDTLQTGDTIRVNHVGGTFNYTVKEIELSVNAYGQIMYNVITTFNDVTWAMRAGSNVMKVVK